MTSRSHARVAALLCCLGTLLHPRAADAHAIVVASRPADRAVLAAPPERLELDFNARMEKRVTRLVLEDATGHAQEVRDVAEAPNRIVVPLEPLAPGAWTLRYKVLATDGHTTEGVLRFTVQAD